MEMDNKPPPTSVYHHHRAPRTPESYFNVPESIALLNIVKSERIQNAFQSNRKNHASVWEMVAEVLNRYSARKRSAKQCCNRYENLKKIYTQLKKNPERHVRRNWPYMFLFKEIEEQRGECWGSNNKRLALINKTHNELSYYHRRRQAATEFSVLMGKQAQAAVVAQQNLLQTLAAQSNDSTTSNATSKLERFLPNHFVEAQLGPDSGGTIGSSVGGAGAQGLSSESTTRNTPALSLTANEATANAANAASALAVSLNMNTLNPVLYADNTVVMPLALQTTRKNLADLTNALIPHHNHHHLHLSHQQHTQQQQPPHQLQDEQQKQQQQMEHPHNEQPQLQQQLQNDQQHHQQRDILQSGHNANTNGFLESNVKGSLPNTEVYEKDCDGALNLQTSDNNVSLKSEPMSDGEFNPDDIQLMQSNYSGSHNFYGNQIDTNILHPDVIVDTDNLTDCSSIDACGDGVNDGFDGIHNFSGDASPKSKRKLSISTDGGDSTNYELIEYLKRREKRDEQMLRRMEAREDRLLNLLERAVQAIEAMIHKNCLTNTNSNENSSTNNRNNNNNNGNNIKRINNANLSKEKILSGENNSSGENGSYNDGSNVAKNNGLVNGVEESWKKSKCLEKFDVKS